MSDTFGRSSPKQFASYDPDSSSWRTWPDIGLWGSVEYSETWPKQGSMRNGRAFWRPTLTPRTRGNGCSSLLKTPTAQLASNGGAQHPDKRRAGGHGPTLDDEVTFLLPTLMASMQGPSQREIDAGNPRRRLETEVHLFPTPWASDGEKGGPNQRGSKGDLMLPSAVMRLDSESTPPRSAGGHELSDGQLQIPQNPTPGGGDA